MSLTLSSGLAALPVREAQAEAAIASKALACPTSASAPVKVNPTRLPSVPWALDA